jgi:hypothetical protein
MTFSPFGTTGMGLTPIGVRPGHVIKSANQRACEGDGITIYFSNLNSLKSIKFFLINLW